MGLLEKLGLVREEKKRENLPVNGTGWSSVLANLSDPPQPAYEISPDAVEQGQPDRVNNPNAIVTQPAPTLPQQLATAREEREIEGARPVVNMDHGWKGFFKEFGKNALFGAAQARQANPNAGWQEVLGGAVAGGGAGSIDRTLNEKREKQADLFKRDVDIARLEQADTYDLNRKIKETQRENIIADNDLNRERVKDLKDYRTQEGIRKTDEAESKRKSAALGKIYGSQWFDPKNPAHRQQAIAAGLNPDEMPKVDLRKPDIKTIGDTTYIYNRETGKLEDSGIPKQGNKTLVDYTVTDPNTGVESTYTTTQEKAAGLKQSFANAGMQIKAANERQDKQQKWQSGENDKKIAAQAARQKVASDLRMNLDNLHRIDGLLKSETDFTRRKQLQDERIEAAKQGKILADQLKDDN